MNRISSIFVACISLVGFCSIGTRAQARPDLVVSQISLRKDAQGIFVEKVTVTVLNACRPSAAGESYVLVTFKQSNGQDAKAIYYVGNTVKALKGGESFTQTFDVAAQKIGFGRFIYAEADPYKKVLEASEDNNWRTMFPDDAAKSVSQGQCTMKM